MRLTRSAVLFASFALPLAVSSNALAAASCDAIAGNVIVNCGFETGDFTGWNLNDSNNYSYVLPENPYTGSYNAYLGAAPGSLSQTFSDVAGAVYSVSFALDNEIAVDQNGVPYPGADSFGVSITDTNGTVTSLLDPMSIPQTSNYNIYNFSFVGTGSDTLNFSLNNIPSYYDLDNVEVNAPTPEPSSLALMGTGAVIFAGYTRRKMKKA